MSLPDIFKENNKETQLTDFKDPFAKDKIESIVFMIYKSMYGKGGIRHSCCVKFQNGETSGEQKIVADNFDELVTKTKIFIESL